MAKYNVGQTTTTDMTGTVADYSVDAQSLDAVSGDTETKWTYPNATEDLGYYKTIPELKKAIDGLTDWTVGRGWKVDDNTKIILEHIHGNGKETALSILKNAITMKKIIGDSFAEIIKNDKGILINLKPISAERMTTLYDKRGRIARYEVEIGKGTKKTFSPEKIFHLINDKVGDEMHGTGVIPACKWVIDARNEAMTDYRVLLHRNNIPVRIIEVDTDDTTKRNALKNEYEQAIRNGEVLIIPKGTVEIKDVKAVIQDPLLWIRYLENFFYQAVGIPKIILGGSQEFTEATSKIGYLTFEQVYMTEQRQLEDDMWEQLGIKIEFERPVSLKDEVVSSEAANTGQVGVQPKDTQATVSRE